GRIYEHGDVAYNLALGIDINGDLNVAALKTAVQHLIDRHEALRITISVDGLTQRIIPVLKVDTNDIDFSGVDPSIREDQLQLGASTEASHAFNLTAGPLIRSHLARISSRRWMLVLMTHHIVTDGWSNGI